MQSCLDYVPDDFAWIHVRPQAAFRGDRGPRDGVTDGSLAAGGLKNSGEPVSLYFRTGDAAPVIVASYADHVATGHYEGEHWLASFAVFLLTETP